MVLRRVQEKMLDDFRPFVAKIAGSLAFLPEGGDVALSAIIAAEEGRKEVFRFVTEEIREMLETREKIREILQKLNQRRWLRKVL